jgi:hypothetical protein
LVGPALLAFGIALWTMCAHKQWRTPIVVLTTLLASEVMAREAMLHLLGTNFPQDRAALHLLPLYILLFAYAIDTLERCDRRWAYAALLLLALPLRTVYSANTGIAMNNGEQTMPPRFIDTVARLQARTDHPLMLAGSGQFSPTWAFYQAAQGAAPIPMRPDPLAGDPDDVRVEERRLLKTMGEGFHIVDSSATSGVFLLFRDRPCQLVPWRDTALLSIRTREEFIALPSSLGTDTTEQCLIFSAMATVVDPSFDVHLVAEVLDNTGADTRYDDVDLTRWPQLASGEQVRVACYMPATPLGGGRKVYLWNRHHADCQLDDIRIQVMHIKR